MPKRSSKSTAASNINPAPDTQPETFVDGNSLPAVIVFDLDYTLWPFWCDTHVCPPLKARDGHTQVTDRTGESFSFYTDVPAILRACQRANLRVAIASRTSATNIALELLRLLRVPGAAPSDQPKKALDFFSYQQIYPGDKRTHLSRIAEASGAPYSDMLFFDDESRNRNVESLGVCFWLVRDGMTLQELDRGVREWRRRRGIVQNAADEAQHD